MKNNDSKMREKMCLRVWNSRWLMLLAFLISHFSSLNCEAQNLTANAPSHVAVGQQFRLSYTVNTQNVSGFRVGGVPDAFEVLMGPSTSSQQRSDYQWSCQPVGVHHLHLYPGGYEARHIHYSCSSHHGRWQ